MKPAPPFREHVYAIELGNLGHYKIHFVFSNDILQSYLKRFEPLRGREYLETAAAMHQGTERGHSWLFFKESVGVSVMVHESWHAVYTMLSWAGIPIENNELIAYSLGYIVSSGQKFQTRNDARIRRMK